MMGLDEKMDEIIQEALRQAAELSRRSQQSREDYETTLKCWIDEIRTEISAR